MRMNKFIKKVPFSIFVVIMLFITKIKVAGAIAINLTNPINTSDFGTLVENFLLWILSVAGALALFMLVAGGIMYMTAGGDDQKVATAKKMVGWTVLGLVLVLVSYSIISVLDDILT